VKYVRGHARFLRPESGNEVSTKMEGERSRVLGIIRYIYDPQKYS
jgi:hypothetical protein